jgi:hypothetical protein
VFCLGRPLLCKGEFQKAIVVLERGLSVCEVGELPVYLPRIAASLGSAYATWGPSEKALPLLEQAVMQGDSTRLMFGHSVVVAHRARFIYEGAEPTRQWTMPTVL